MLKHHHERKYQTELPTEPSLNHGSTIADPTHGDSSTPTKDPVFDYYAGIKYSKGVGKYVEVNQDVTSFAKNYERIRQILQETRRRQSSGIPGSTQTIAKASPRAQARTRVQESHHLSPISRSPQQSAIGLLAKPSESKRTEESLRLPSINRRVATISHRDQHIESESKHIRVHGLFTSKHKQRSLTLQHLEGYAKASRTLCAIRVCEAWIVSP